MTVRRFSKVRFGAGLIATDEGNNVISLDAPGTAGPPGPTGPTGPAGPIGPAGPGVPAGGTTGQVLTKTSGTDYATSWTTISGGGGTVAADPIWDAKGDLAVGTGADTAIRLAAGTTGQVLTVDATTASGLKWAAAAGGGAFYEQTSAPTGAPLGAIWVDTDG
jgi:hypothetical protein